MDSNKYQFWNGSSSPSVALTLITFTLSPCYPACPQQCFHSLFSNHPDDLHPDVPDVSAFAISLLACPLFAVNSYSPFKAQLRCQFTQKPSIISSSIGDRPLPCAPRAPPKCPEQTLYILYIAIFWVFFFPLQYIKKAKREMGHVTIVLEPRKMSNID